MILRGRGAALALLFPLVLASCSTPAPELEPNPLASSPSGNALVRDIAAVLVRISAYDYALAGYFAGANARVVTPDRYAAAVRADANALLRLKDRVVQVAFAEPALGSVLADLGDRSAVLADDLLGLGGAAEAEAFARVLADVDAAWSALRATTTRAPADDELAARVARAGAWRITVARAPAYGVVSAPDNKRLATFDDLASAERRAAELRAGGATVAVAPVERFTFGRSGPAPSAELWREPALDVATGGRARRGALTASGFIAVNDDGSTWVFDADGRTRSFAKLTGRPNVAATSDDGRWVLVAGQNVAILGPDGALRGGAVRLPSAASSVAWVERRRVFVAGSQGPTGKPEGGAGAVVALGLDGGGAGEPFPLVTPAAGPAIAASPARDEVYVATTSSGTTDVEALRPGVDTRVRLVVRAPGQVVDFAIDPEASYAAISTAQGTYRFRPTAQDSAATLQLIAPTSRAVRYGADGTLYLLGERGLTAFDRALASLWSAPLGDGRRIALGGRRLVVQDGLSRTLLLDARTGAADELASLGEIDDLAISSDGARVLLLISGRRAVLFALP